MKKYTVDVKAFIGVEVFAESAEEARQVANEWVEWLSPTADQLEDYQSDFPAGLAIEGYGGFEIDGVSDVEEDEYESYDK